LCAQTEEKNKKIQVFILYWAFLLGIFMLISAQDASIHAYQSEKIEINLSWNDLF
jgi:hypothetical protein